jgi:zinc protease
METAGGKADQIGFSTAVLDDPGAVFARLAAYRAVTPAEIQRAAARWLAPRSRTVIRVVPSGGGVA